MQTAQKGHGLILILLVVTAFVGIYLLSSSTQVKLTTPKIAQISNNLSYQDSELAFRFEYSNDFEVINESEEQYSERTQTQYRKNFKYYVTYEPPKFVKGIIVKHKDADLTSDQFQSVPLTLWVFENPNNLSAEQWYKDFWYYPFVWGVFAEPQKSQIAPASGAAQVSYQPGQPKFILIPKDGKMFLFKVMEGEDILSSFKFI